MAEKKSIVDIIKEKRLFFDGGTGTVLQGMGLPAGTPPERWSLEHPEKIVALHRSYVECGANIIKTNTFGVNALKYENWREYIEQGIALAREAIGDKEGCFVALDIGPLGRMLKPLGDLDFEDAVELFAKNARGARELGADLVLIETMADSYETKAAVLGVKESCDLPVFVTNAYDGSGKLMTGASPEAMAALLEGLSVDAIGANCSFGPDKLLPIVSRLAAVSSLPVIFNPNAGLPRTVEGVSRYDIDPVRFAGMMRTAAESGAAILGGCCGTTPEYIRETVRAVEDIDYKYPEKKNITAFSSYTHAVTVGECPRLIGERINPTGKPRLKEALREGNISYLLSEALRQEEAGVDALDVNVGLPEIDEPMMMKRVISELQAVTDLPLQIDTGNAAALEGAMRIYNGKPLVNSVNGKEESLSSVLPLVKKYGGVLIALTVDERGIPSTAEERVAIAERIAARAAEYGIDKRDIVVDPLAMAVSSDPSAAGVTLKAIRLLRERGYKTSLGVSNASFGLPERDRINSVYFTMALSAGLDLAIMNPHSLPMTDAYRGFLALTGRDEGFKSYISHAEKTKGQGKAAAQSPTSGGGCGSADIKSKTPENDNLTLQKAIIKGLRQEAARLALEALSVGDPLEVVNREIIPALGEVGDGFERGSVYLPGLLMSAEAASAAFAEVKKILPEGSGDKGKIILATVKGDIHDIGKNIVRVLLESHGFGVLDLGRDVSPEAVLAAARESGIRVVGLSALMTTTVPAMEETVRLLHRELPDCRVMVGGAVLTKEYADMIGADAYAPDGVSAVRVAELLCALDK